MSTLDSISKIIEPAIVDISTFINGVTLAATSKIAQYLLKQEAENEITQIGLRRQLDRQKGLTDKEMDGIRQRFQNLNPQVSLLLSTEIKVLAYNLQTVLLISYTASAILFGINTNLIAAFVLVCVIRHIFARAIDSAISQSAQNVPLVINLAVLKKLNSWLRGGTEEIPIGQKTYGIFRQSALFTKILGAVIA